MGLVLNSLLKVYMPLNKETKPNQTKQNTLAQAESLLHSLKQAARGIALPM